MAWKLTWNWRKKWGRKWNKMADCLSVWTSGWVRYQLCGVPCCKTTRKEGGKREISFLISLLLFSVNIGIKFLIKYRKLGEIDSSKNVIHLWTGRRSTTMCGWNCVSCILQTGLESGGRKTPIGMDRIRQHLIQWVHASKASSSFLTCTDTTGDR